MIKIVMAGACGRMGKRILSLAQENPEFIIHGAVEHPGHPDLGKDVGSIIGAEEIGVSVTDTLTDAASGTDVIIDFSIPDAALSHARCAAENGIAFVIGITGLGENDVSELKEITRTISCVMAPNMSVGVNLLFSLVKKAAAALGDSYDVEITEFHHRFKKDAPSGTAMRLLEIVANEMDRDLQKDAIYGRKGIIGERKQAEIGMHALRGGDVVGEHTVFFTTPGERLELTHRANSRDAFAQGALRAARFAVESPAGFYDMQDVLGMK